MTQPECIASAPVHTVARRRESRIRAQLAAHKLRRRRDNARARAHEVVSRKRRQFRERLLRRALPTVHSATAAILRAARLGRAVYCIKLDLTPKARARTHARTSPIKLRRVGRLHGELSSSSSSPPIVPVACSFVRLAPRLRAPAPVEASDAPAPALATPRCRRPNFEWDVLVAVTPQFRQ